MIEFPNLEKKGANMRARTWLILGLLVCLAGGICGCARTARDTTGFATSDSLTVKAPFKEVWQATKAILREKDYDLYTRDKRGVFVAFSGAKRHFILNNHRVKVTVALEPQGDDATQVTIESVRQVFGVTLLTYPGWHDRKMVDSTEAKAILEAITAKFGGSAPSPETPAPTTAPTT
jgi:hypothetical protein